MIKEQLPKGYDRQLTKEILAWLKSNNESSVYHLIASVYLDYRMGRLSAEASRLAFEGYIRLEHEYS